jgi:hypothetical protein
MALKKSKAVKPPLRTPIGKRAEVAPVDLDLLPGERFETDEGLLLFETVPNFAEIGLNDRRASVKALSRNPLKDHGSGGLRIDLKKPLDLLFEGVQFTGPVDGRPLVVGISEELPHGFSVEMQSGGYSPLGQALLPEAMDLEDGVPIDHGFLPGSGESAGG